MAGNKKPRKPYRPKDQWVSPMQFVKENLSLLCEFDPDYVLRIRLLDHSAMTAIQRGTATKRDMDNISATYNLIFGMWKTLPMPPEAEADFARVIYHANEAFRAVCARANETRRVVCRAEELQALNNLIDLNDNLLDVVTVKQWYTALQHAKSTAKATKLSGEGIPS